MLKTRVLTAVCLAIFFLFLLFQSSAALWLICCAVFAGIAAWEWFGLLMPSHNRTALLKRGAFVGVVGIVTLLLGSRAGLHDPQLKQSAPLWVLFVGSTVFWLVIAPLWLRVRWRPARLLSGLGTGLVLICATALALAFLRQTDKLLLLGAMSLVWMADIAAYFAGRRFGQRKLAPFISPGKTWEGALGAALGVTVLGLIYVVVGLGVTGLNAILFMIFFVVFTALSIEGDLLESLLKRHAGFKDSGTILPGHGGLLDRIDSLLSTLPLVALCTLYFR